MADVRDIQMNFTANTSQAEAAIQRLKGSTDQAAGSLDKQAKSTVNANGAVVSFGRIIQDAPFGIIGVANNITMLSEQFVSLKAQAGSTGAALTAMKAAMFGPLGLTLAISAVTTGLQFWALSNNKVDSSAKAAINRVKEMTESAKIFNAVQKQGVVEGLTQISTLQRLAREYDTTGTSIDRKKKILSAVNALSPDVIKSLNSQKDSEKSLSTAIKETTSSIYNKVEAQLIDSLLAPKYAQLSKTFGELQRVSEKYYTERARLYGKLGVGANPETISQIMKGQGFMDELTNAEIEFSTASKDFGKHVENVKGLATRVMGSFAPGISGTGDFVPGGKDAKGKATTLQDTIREALRTDDLLYRLTSSSSFADYLSKLNAELSKYKEGTAEFNNTLETINEVKKKELLINAMKSSMESEGQLKAQLIWGDQKSFWGVKGLGVSGDQIRKLDGKKTYFPQMRDEVNLDLVKDKNNLLIKEGVKNAKKEFDIYKDHFIDPFVSSFQGEFSKAWQSIFGEANSLLEKFIQSLGESLFNKAVGSAASGILGMIFPGFNLLEAAVGGGGGGDRATVNQIIMDGELIATQKQANRTQAIINRQNALR
jgi:hypothetical protein